MLSMYDVYFYGRNATTLQLLSVIKYGEITTVIILNNIKFTSIVNNLIKTDILIIQKLTMLSKRMYKTLSKISVTDENKSFGGTQCYVVTFCSILWCQIPCTMMKVSIVLSVNIFKTEPYSSYNCAEWDCQTKINTYSCDARSVWKTKLLFNNNSRHPSISGDIGSASIEICHSESSGWSGLAIRSLHGSHFRRYRIIIECGPKGLELLSLVLATYFVL